MSQLVERSSQPEMGGANFFLRRLEVKRFQEYGWQEPYESRGSRTVLRGTGGEIPPVYPTNLIKPSASLWTTLDKTFLTAVSQDTSPVSRIVSKIVLTTGGIK